MALTGKSAEELFLRLGSGPPMLEFSTCCGIAPLE